jgi:hypothetical protein
MGWKFEVIGWVKRENEECYEDRTFYNGNNIFMMLKSVFVLKNKNCGCIRIEYRP